MKITKVTLAAVLALTVAFTSCKPKDADIEKAVQAKETTGITVSVKDGVATLTGEVADNAAKAKAVELAKAEKGVKDVVNNLTVPAPVAVTPPPASMTTPMDAGAMQKVSDGLKDIKGITVDFAGDKAVISGEVTSANRMKIMQILAAAKVKSDVSKLMDKK